jgi:hypothetical protein
MHMKKTMTFQRARHLLPLPWFLLKEKQKESWDRILDVEIGVTEQILIPHETQSGW